jgi:ATP-binding protein involved in chromosome partitioning
MPNAAQVLDALRPLQDPALKKSLVDLAAVEKLRIEENKVSFDLVLSSPAYAIKHLLKDQAEKAVLALEGVASVTVQISRKIVAPRLMNKEPLPGIKHIVAVSSGKGGVGKSTVAVNLACALAQQGAKVGILDADIYGPNVPIMMGLTDATLKAVDPETNKALLPANHGVKVMSISFLVKPDQAMIWRGPILHKSIAQFFSDMAWGELDYLLIDLPPGTGDAQLSISQLAPITGGLIVTTPQDVSLADCRRANSMFKQTQIPVLGVVENMSYYVNRHGEKEFLFGEGGGQRLADEVGLTLLGQVPLYPKVRENADKGQPIVVSDTECDAAQELTRIANTLIDRLNDLAENPPEESTEAPAEKASCSAG